MLKFVSYDEQLPDQHFTFLSFPNAGSQELKNNRYYILCFSDKTFGKESSNLEIKSLLKAILHPCQSDTLYDQRRCPRGKLSAVDRVDYLDLLSVLNSLTVAETFSTTLFSLFGSKVNILTLTVPNVLENNLIIKRTILGSDNVCVCISTFSQGFCGWVFQCEEGTTATALCTDNLNYQVFSLNTFPFQLRPVTHFPELQHITVMSFSVVNLFQSSCSCCSSGGKTS